MYFLLKMGIFHCYVSLPEGNQPGALSFIALKTGFKAPHGIDRQRRNAKPPEGADEKGMAEELLALTLTEKAEPKKNGWPKMFGFLIYSYAVRYTNVNIYIYVYVYMSVHIYIYECIYT